MSAADWRLCAVVPTYDNPMTVRGVVEGLRSHDVPVIVVDDGSGPAGEAACRELGAAGLAEIRRLPRNQGKGGAVQAGFDAARELGFTHALQVDADGQHDLAQVPVFATRSLERPEAFLLGFPEYDESAPQLRRKGRKVTDFWVNLEVGRGRIRDAMIGFRVYPLAACAKLPRMGRGMEFDIEVAVRLVQAGTETINLPVKVRYLSAEEGGVSHFRMFRDNVRFGWLHCRLCTAGSLRWFFTVVTGRRWRK